MKMRNLFSNGAFILAIGLAAWGCKSKCSALKDTCNTCTDALDKQLCLAVANGGNSDLCKAANTPGACSQAVQATGGECATLKAKCETCTDAAAKASCLPFANGTEESCKMINMTPTATLCAPPVTGAGGGSSSESTSTASTASGAGGAGGGM